MTTNDELAAFHRRLADAQRPLPIDAARLLFAHLWELMGEPTEGAAKDASTSERERARS